MNRTIARGLAVGTAAAMAVLTVIAIVAGRPGAEIAIYAVITAVTWTMTYLAVRKRGA